MRYIHIAPLALFAAVLPSGCGQRTATNTPTQVASPKAESAAQSGVQVEYAKVRRGTLSATVTATGMVIADGNAQASLAFPIDGQIRDVTVSVNERVHAGQTLATLTSTLSARAVAQAEADDEAARAAMDRARAGARPQEFAQSAAALRAAETRVTTTAAELRRQESLAAAGIASRRDVEQARAAFADAQADAQSKASQGSLLRAGPRPQDVAVAEAQLRQADESLLTARARAALGMIVAPFDGIVTARLKNAGEVVDPSTPVVALVDPTRAIIEAHLTEDQATVVRPGDRASFLINDGSRPSSGIVESVGSVYASDTRTLSARIRPLGATLLPGIVVRLSIHTHTADALIVPESAVVKDPDTGRAEVFVPGDRLGAYRKVPVHIVLQEGAQVAVRAPSLREGQPVVSRGAYELLPYVGGSN